MEAPWFPTVLSMLEDVPYQHPSVNHFFRDILLGDLCYLAICVNDLHALYGPICAYSSVRLLYFCIIFCPCTILSSFSEQISPPVESVYWFHIVSLSHIVFPHLYGVTFLLYNELCSLGALLSLVFYEQWSALCVVSYAGLAISRQWFEEQIRFDRATWGIHNNPQKQRNIRMMMMIWC